MALEAICDAVLTFNKSHLIEAIENALAVGLDVEEILNKGLISAMEKLGDDFANGTLFVPEMLLGAMTMKSGLEVIRPHLQGSNIETRGTIVIGTVQGDQHDVGKNLVAMMLEGGGFKVIDLGVNQAKENFLEAAKQHSASIIGLSALLTTCMPMMQETVAYLKQNTTGVKILVGGAPITQTFAMRIGANGYGRNGAEAVQLAKALIEKESGQHGEEALEEVRV